uniref:Uncharacterized protein n=1 Tax=Chrysotila carterae TaxID=13221 RepID=A0A6S9R768_CHRCT|mmetsp:Transcript_54157/g.118103  ORF Transcript_54157/g.118103 Transcript_54157/m.118103 type:complete len:140 (+) Transcript_54157:684-1103(+)
MPLRKLTMWKCRERCELVSSFGLLFTTSFFRPHRARVRICSLRAAVHFPCARVGQVGWLIRRVNGVDVPADRTAIIKATAASMKAGPVKITFQIQLEDNTYACVSCDKFVHADEFDGDQLELGPGKHMCRGCAEFADMF